jgi:hypothetical protein
MNPDHYYTREGSHDLMAHVYYSGDLTGTVVVLSVVMSVILASWSLMAFQVLPGSPGDTLGFVGVFVLLVGGAIWLYLMYLDFAGKKLLDRCHVCQEIQELRVFSDTHASVVHR